MTNNQDSKTAVASSTEELAKMQLIKTEIPDGFGGYKLRAPDGHLVWMTPGPKDSHCTCQGSVPPPRPDYAGECAHIYAVLRLSAQEYYTISHGQSPIGK